MRRRRDVTKFLAPWQGGYARLIAAAISAFLILPTAAIPAGSAEQRPEVVVVAFGLFGDQSVFESEAKGAAEIVADHFGGGQVIVRANTRERTDATVETLAAALDMAAKEVDAQNGILALILTSHGSRAGLSVKAAGASQDTLWPQTLAGMLDHTGVRHRIVIISACYSGVFIPVLANADTLVITAADAYHPSFGCEDGAQWTYFGDAFFNNAMRRTRSLREAFALARTLVRERELRSGFAASNPQIAGGENIEPPSTSSLQSAQTLVQPWQPAEATVLPWPAQ
jgi:hypothetical protein